MRKVSALLLLLAISSTVSMSSWAVSNQLFNELMTARSEIFMTQAEHKDSMKKALAVLVGCELDELCVMIALKHMSTNEDNLLYIHFYNKLLARRDDILYSSMQCQSPELDTMRKTMASCFVTLNTPLTESMDIKTQNRANRAFAKCSRVRLTKLAQEKGNVFAQAKILEYEINQRNEEGIRYWYNSMFRMYTQNQYHVYSRCSDKI